jgi:hypothetical protein
MLGSVKALKKPRIPVQRSGNIMSVTLARNTNGMMRKSATAIPMIAMCTALSDASRSQVYLCR